MCVCVCVCVSATLSSAVTASHTQHDPPPTASGCFALSSVHPHAGGSLGHHYKRNLLKRKPKIGPVGPRYFYSCGRCAAKSGVGHTCPPAERNICSSQVRSPTTPSSLSISLSLYRSLSHSLALHCISHYNRLSPTLSSMTHISRPPSYWCM